MTAWPRPRQPDPFRPPAWRWLAAGSAADPDAPLLREADPAVRAARRYRLALAACRTAADRRRLAAAMPLLDRAYRIDADPDGAARAALEARVLAGEAPAEIATRLNALADVIEAYEALFFDVRPELARPDYVMHQAIGPAVRGAEWGFAVAWKVFAYLGGPRVLDAVMLHAVPGPRPQRPEDVLPFLTAAARAAVARRAAATAHALDPATAARLTAAPGRPGGRAAGADAAPLSPDEKLVKALLDAVGGQFRTGQAAVDAESPVERVYDNLPGEPSADELARLAAGEEIPGLLEELSQPLPPPRRAKRSVLMDEPPDPPAQGPRHK